jgi:adenylylsulfate kinase-like enzyme
MIYWITGPPGAGKTTFAKKLASMVDNSVILDGDDLRKKWNNYDYSFKGRLKHISETALFAKFLEKNGALPICALVSPTKRLRRKATKHFNRYILFYAKGNNGKGLLWQGTEYEEPDASENAIVVEWANDNRFIF